MSDNYLMPNTKLFTTESHKQFKESISNTFRELIGAGYSLEEVTAYMYNEVAAEMAITTMTMRVEHNRKKRDTGFEEDQ